MSADQNTLTLIPAPDEPASAGREIPLEGHGRSAGVNALARVGAFPGRGMSIVRKGMGGIFAGPLPDLVSLLAAPALAAAATAAVAWLQGRSGRKVRLKVGDTEAEARTVGELREMLSMAQDLKKKSSEKEP